jgi:hypothetical protein
LTEANKDPLSLKEKFRMTEEIQLTFDQSIAYFEEVNSGKPVLD